MTSCVRFHDDVIIKDNSTSDVLHPYSEHLISKDLKTFSKMIRMTDVNSRLANNILSKNRECQDMHMKLFEATVTNSRLMDQMSQLAVENQQLRLQMLAIREENDELHSQLSYSAQRWPNGAYSAYGPTCKRWFQNHSGTDNPSNAESPEGSAESWEEVSQKLLNQMKQEMIEMEDLGQRLAAENNSTLEDNYRDSSEIDGRAARAEMDAGIDDMDLERVRMLIQGLKGQSEHMKGQLITQRVVLQSALNQLKKAAKSGAVVLTKKAIATAATGDISKNKFDRPSDELFRAYFTQQLHNSSGSQPCQRSTDTDDQRSNSEETKENHLQEQKANTGREHSPDDKICPVCEASFPYEMPQEEFQNHVMDHFENENSTLLQQYELL